MTDAPLQHPDANRRDVRAGRRTTPSACTRAASPCTRAGTSATSGRSSASTCCAARCGTCSGYKVRQVMNFTDVDDRTIVGAQKAGMDLRAYTDQYIAAFREDARALGLETVEEMPRATDEANLQAMARPHRRARRERAHLSQRRLDLLQDLDAARLRQAGASRSRGHEGRRARRRGQLREGRRARLRAVEGDEARRADVGRRRSAGPAGLAPRVLGDGAAAARRAADRHPRRRHRPDLPAPRERDRAERGRDRQAVLALLGPRRVPARRRPEDVEVARQHLHDSRHRRARASGRRRCGTCCCRRTTASS